MELPRALQPWQPALSIFPRDLAIALGGVIDKLALLVGPLVSPDGAGRNDPDGLEGIGRRGSFERLLMTDWALANEAPLEFLRRVSTGELSFLEIAHRKPTVARQCIVLFDVGPDQRGGPRIVHLALLILLAQRARAGHASFSWGILQDLPGQLFGDVNEESVRQLVKGGSHRYLGVEDILGVYESLSKEDAEIWFIGGPHLWDVVSEISPYRIRTEDSWDPDAPQDLQVTVSSQSGKTHSATIGLPPGNAAVRLLRDPFEVARVQPQKSQVRIAEDTNIVLSRDHRKLFLRGAEGELITIPIPNSPNCSDPPKPRIFRPPPEETLAAAGRLMGNRIIAAVTLDTEGVNIHELSPRGCTSVRKKHYKWKSMGEPDQAICRPPWVPTSKNVDLPMTLGTLIQLHFNGPFFVHDGGQVLFQTDKETIHHARFPAHDIHHDCTLLSWLKTYPSPEWITLGTTEERITLPAGTHAIRIGPGGYLAAGGPGMTWHILTAKGQIEHTRQLPLGFQVLGVADIKEFIFYVLDSNRLQIHCIGSEKSEVCFTAPARIKAITATPTCWLIVFITAEDELCVYSRDHKTLVFRMHLGGT